MTKRFDDDETILKDGILKDGATLTVKMFMKDGVTPNPNLSPVQLAVAATQNAMADDAAILDAAHKPGFIRAAPVITDAMVARNKARAEYYDAYDQSVSTAWERKAPVADATDDPRTAYHDSVKEKYSRTDLYDAASARDAKEAAYAAYDATVEHAWQNK
jgi:hypothetical protein